MTTSIPLRRLHILTCGAVVALLVACGAPGDGGIDSVDPSGQRVTLWHTQVGERAKALGELIDAYNSSNDHDIQVEARHMGSHAELYHQMTLGIEGAPLPQIVEAYQNQLRSYHQEKAIVDLAPYMASARWGLSAEEQQDFIPEFLQQDRLGKKQLALLPNRSMEVLYYNRDWLKELGYDEPPADWATFVEMCRAAAGQPFSKATDGTPAGIRYEKDASRLASIIFSLGGDVMNDAQTRYTYDTPQARQALTMIRDLVGDGAAELVGDNEDRQPFIDGQSLFAQRSSSSAAQIATSVQQGPGFDWGVVGLPFEADVPVSNVYGASLAVVRSTPEQQVAAWHFVHWFVQPDQQDRWASASGYFPVRRSVALRLAPYFSVAYNLLQHGKAEPSVGGYEPVRALVVDAMSQIVEQQADIDATLAQLQADADETLKPYR